MHILFSPEKASDVGDFGVAFNRFKHVNRLCERYFPSISSLFPLSNGYASYFVQNLHVLSFTLILRRQQLSQILGWQTPYIRGVLHCVVSYCFSVFPASLISLRRCSERSAFTHQHKKEADSLRLWKSCSQKANLLFCWQIFRCQRGL